MSFIDLLPPFEQRGMDLSLDRMQRALKALGHPCGSVPAVQVVGTNGKGSIASFIHSALVHAGIRTGLTTSPHLVDWTCLLYTSPSPRDGLLSRMPSSA